MIYRNKHNISKEYFR